MKKVIMGNHALSYGAMLSRSQVISAYPITPQTQVVELLSEMCADGTLDAQFIKVESEHSAMASCIGASVAGARTFTATSSQGLALMHEMLHWAGGGRHPIVMGNVNRSMAPGWSIWTDQNDSLSAARHGLDAVLLRVEPGGRRHGHPGLQGRGDADDPGHGHPRRLRPVAHLRGRRRPGPGPGRQVPAAVQAGDQADPGRSAGLRRPDRGGALHGAPLQAREGHGEGAGPDRGDGPRVREDLRPQPRARRPLPVRRRRFHLRHLGDGGLHGPGRRRRAPEVRRQGREPAHQGLPPLPLRPGPRGPRRRSRRRPSSTGTAPTARAASSTRK